MEKFITILWAIWNYKNRVIFHHKCNPVEIIKHARNTCHIPFLYNMNTYKIVQDNNIGIVHQWKNHYNNTLGWAPPPQIVKVE